jgi:2-polyprenyl-3-methyl-5-hydroxy-6-metoxy-1,4-benzoquinol methylase
MDKETLLKSFADVVSYLFDSGQILKAYVLLLNAPSIIDEDETIITLFTKVKTKLQTMADLQNHGSTRGNINWSFVDPQDPRDIVKFKLLKEEIETFKLKTLVDIGCYTGWLGRELSLDGVAVHGIDVHPLPLQFASLMSAGTLATFEFLPVTKLSMAHKREYDGAVFFDSLEHVFDPLRALRSAEEAVKLGGWVFISLPYFETEHQVQFEETHDDKTKEHLNSFSQKELTTILGRKKNLLMKLVVNEGQKKSWFIKYQVWQQ